MAGAARKGDSISGTTDSSHVIIGYDGDGIPYYGSSSISGSISGNCSPNVFINGMQAVFVGSTTTETDQQDTGSGIVSSGSSSVYVNGKALARNGDSISPHTGTAHITSGSSNVIIG